MTDEEKKKEEEAKKAAEAAKAAKGLTREEAEKLAKDAVEKALADERAKRESDEAAKKKADEEAKAREKETANEAIRRLEADVKRERSLNRITAAAAKIPWFEPQDAINELSKDVVEKDGKTLVTVEDVVSGVKMNRQLPLEEAVQVLAKTKKHWVKADVAGGSGAGGDSGADAGKDAKEYTMDDLRKGIDFVKETGPAKVKLA